MASSGKEKSLKIVGFHGTSNGYLKSIGTRKVPLKTERPVGLFGGHGGFYWNDGKQAAIKQVKVKYASAINSISAEYYENGISWWSPIHGGRGGKSAMVTLDHPNEFLISVSGYYSILNGILIIMSLLFKSNKRTFGPYGTQNRTYFSSPNGKIVGFYGKSGTYLDSIGFHTRVLAETMKSIGTFGGPGGFDWDDGKHTAIKQINLRYGKAIKSIATKYEDIGISTWSARHGGIGRTTTARIILDHPNEFLISISGYYALFGKDLVLVSLTFQSNKRMFGPYGPTSGTHFSLPSPRGRIVGFFGKSGKYLDSIGAHVMVTEPELSLGTYGGSGGVADWDDGKHAGIKQVKLLYAKAIDSITTEYVDNGVSTWSAKHGGDGGTSTATITLNHPNEFIVSVSGNYSIFRNAIVLVSLTFESNMRVFGPYGDNKGTYFSLSSPGGKIVGFFGKFTKYIDSIGAHVMPITDSVYPSYVESFGGNGLNLQKDGRWDDYDDYDMVRKITVGPSEKGIQHVSFVYRKNGKSFAAQGHGDKPAKLYETQLQVPGEFLISVSGYYDEATGIVQSLKFQTNKRLLGPFGNETGIPF